MIAIPAIDLRDGACVQLVGGSYEDERIRLADPVGVAAQWVSCGFTRLHIVDLDAATGRGSNDAMVRDLVRTPGAQVQAGGGVRTTERVDELLAAGARHVVVGTRAVADSAWLGEIAHAHPDAVIVAADVRDRTVVTHGWAESAGRDIIEFLSALRPLPLGGVLVTAVHKEGQLGGTDFGLMDAAVRASAVPVIASGGVTTVADLERLEASGVAGAVIGMALYTGALDARILAERYGQ